jgi:hypothetical protein
MQPLVDDRAPLFELGQIVITDNALQALSSAAVMESIDRHAAGDWGELPPEDSRANERALEGGGRLFSAYDLAEGTRVWIITEADRSVTTILLPEDY